MTLTEFLLARMDEDEADARAAARPRYPLPDIPGDQPHWSYDGNPSGAFMSDGGYGVGQASSYESDEEGGGGRFARHIVRWDPARVLAEVEAKRRIVANHEPYPKVNGCCLEHSGFEPFEYMDCNVCCEASQYADSGGYCLTLRAVALPYADHADYQKEWRP